MIRQSLVSEVPILQEIIDLLFGFHLGVAVLLLKEARQLVAFAGDLIHFIIGQLAPFFTN